MASARYPDSGRIVHCVCNNGSHAAAVIVSNHTGPTANLNIWPNAEGDIEGVAPGGTFHASCVKQDEGQAPGTWHWPER